jgi:hypothetical protein
MAGLVDVPLCVRKATLPVSVQNPARLLICIINCISVHTLVFSPTRLGAFPASCSETFRFTLNTLSTMVHASCSITLNAVLFLRVSLVFEFLVIKLFKTLEIFHVYMHITLFTYSSCGLNPLKGYLKYKNILQ